jgi:exopolysaccharide biosynthesis polyprenyl glycosylphosphotransferase
VAGVSQIVANQVGETRSGAAPVVPHRPAPRWARRYLVTALAADAFAVLVAAIVAFIWRFGLAEPDLDLRGAAVPYVVVAALLVPIWLGLIAVAGGYDRRIFGIGTDEYRKLIATGAYVLAAIALLVFVFKLPVARGLVLACIPLAVFLTVSARFFLRQHLQRSRAQGHSLDRVLVVGDHASIERVGRQLAHASWAGYRVVGACSTKPAEAHTLEGDEPIPVVGGIGDIVPALGSIDIDALVVANASVLPPGELENLSWILPEAGVHLLVAPGTTDIGGATISARPAAGLPLVHVDQPHLSAGGRVYKAVFDPVLAAFALVVLSPLLLVTAIAVRCSSSGPVLFRQVRVGRNGRPFVMWKFRTMRRQADQENEDLFLRANDGAGALFKLRRDPRVTPVGRVLRRFSIDELPQLVQVLSGRMSLVGPRPHLPESVALYDGEVHRRLFVRPGLTGLWQVNGRTDLPWDEAVRLDLYYVDRWSPAMDLAILLKTAGAVLRGTGAY